MNSFDFLCSGLSALFKETLGATTQIVLRHRPSCTGQRVNSEIAGGGGPQWRNVRTEEVLCRSARPVRDGRARLDLTKP
jgi:hypothetical protein